MVHGEYVTPGVKTCYAGSCHCQHLDVQSEQTSSETQNHNCEHAKDVKVRFCGALAWA